jgi:hypothetical protein
VVSRIAEYLMSQPIRSTIFVEFIEDFYFGISTDLILLRIVRKVYVRVARWSLVG